LYELLNKKISNNFGQRSMKDKPLFTLVAVYLLGTLLFLKPDIIFNVDLGKPVLKTEQVALSTATSKKAALWQDKLTAVKEVLGKPDFVSSLQSEGDKEDKTVFHYRKDKLYIKGSYLDAYELVDSQMVVGKKCGPNFKVGDHVSAVNEFIPIRYMQNYKLTADLLTEDGSTTGHFIQIQINPSDSKIRSIMVASR
jgi:hypothetical protein